MTLKPMVKHSFNFKKEIGLFFLLLCLGALFLRFFFQPTFPQTHDGQNHLARLANLDLAVRDHHFPFRWAGNLNHKFGYPVFNFNYYLPELFSLFISKANLPFEASLKIFIIMAYILGSFFWYLFLRLYFKPLASFCGGLLSLSAIYPLTIIWVRGSPGETLALALFPLALLLIKKYLAKPGRWHFLSVVLVLFLFLLSHNLTVLFGFPLIIIFSLFQRRSWLVALAPFFLSLGLSLFFWLPVIMEKQFTYLKYFNSAGYQEHFPSLLQLIYSPWGFGYSVPGTADGFSFQLGPFHWLAVLTAIIIFFFTKRIKSLTADWLFFFLTFFLYLFLTLPLSGLVWRFLPFINFIQYPWRLLLFLTLSSIWLGAFVAYHKPKLGIFLAFASVIYALMITRPQSGFHWQDHYYHLFPFTSTVGQEAMPVWFDEAKISPFFDSDERIIGADNFNLQLWQTQTHIYQITLNQDSDVFEKTVYFPGWELTIDNRPTAISYQNPDYPGLIGYHLTAGTHNITTRFTENTPARRIGNTVSLTSLGLLFLGFVFFPKIKKLHF